jgi:hypothetical protein
MRHAMRSAASAEPASQLAGNENIFKFHGFFRSDALRSAGKEALRALRLAQCRLRKWSGIGVQE